MHWIDQLIILGALALMLLFGWLKKSSSENAEGSSYLLGSRSLTLPAFVATTVTTWYGGILGVGEYSYLYGISNWLVFGVPYYFGAILFALLLSKRARAGQSLTLPQHLERAYGGRVGILSAVLVVFTTVPAAYALIIANLLQLSFGLSLGVGIFVAVLYSVVYIWRGGFSAVVHTDKLQFVLMFGGFAMILIFLLIHHGIEPLIALRETSARHFTWNGGLDTGAVLVWYFIALSTMVEPNFYQRCFAAKTPKIAQQGLFVSVGFWLLFDLLATSVGLYARALLPDLANPLHSYPALAQAVLPVGLMGVFFITLFATALSTLDSSLFTVGTTIGRDILKTEAGPKLLLRTRFGLIIGAAVTAALAMAYSSVVSLWRILGSLSAASLLIPILFAYYPRYKPRSSTTLAMILAGSISTIFWEAMKWHSGAYPWRIQPLFVGLSFSLFILAIERLAINFRTKRKNNC
ncbi:MAG: sodium:solute symporter family protein [Bradymonadia bacterium]|jgi:SSS family solute:Na+ symporter